MSWTDAPEQPLPNKICEQIPEQQRAPSLVDRRLGAHGALAIRAQVLFWA